MSSTAIDRRTLTHRGAVVAYRVAGPSGAPAAVLLPPAFCDTSVLDELAAALADTHRVIAVDLPGHGDTVVGTSGITMADAPEAVVAVLDAEGVASAHVLGVSLGSLVAQAVADRTPDRVGSVTVVGGYSAHRPVAALQRAQLVEGLRWAVLLAVSMPRFHRHVVRTSAATARGRAVLAASVGRFERRGFRAMSGAGALLRRTDDVAAHPLLVVVGALDRPLLREAAAALHADVPGSALAVVPGAGHCVMVDAPEVLAQRVREFLAGVERVAG